MMVGLLFAFFYSRFTIAYMRLLFALLVCLVISTAGFPQTKPVLRLKAKLDFTGPEKDRIVTYKFLDGENKLLLVGTKNVRMVDVANGVVLESHPIDIPELNEDNPRVISPDGRRMLVFGNYSSTDKQDKVKRLAAIWDLQTGKRIATLDRPSKPVRAGFWSKNGKTLVTSSDKYAPHIVDSTAVDVAFWNGETFKYQNSLPADRVSWWYLTDDSSKCFFATAPITNWFFIDRFIGNSRGPINVWDVSSGKIETSISAGDGSLERKIRGISVGPDERFLAFVSQPSKSNKSDRILHVWEIDKSRPIYEVKAKYEIKPAPKISEYGVTFSPDGKYFAFDAGKTLQIYEATTGEKKSELPKGYVSTYWLNDNRVLLYNYSDKIKGFEVSTGKRLYEQKLIYDVFQYASAESDGYTSSGGEFIVADETKIVSHPAGKLFLTYSNQYVKVYEAQTGEVVQTRVTPPIDTSRPPDPKKGPRLIRNALVWKADWSSDGQTLYIIGADRSSVSLWGF
jgi:hypothetical protein